MYVHSISHPLQLNAWQCISKVRTVIKYFHKSTFAHTHLSALRVSQNIGHGLVAIGNTRFLTLYYAGSSLLECLSAIEQLIKDGVISVAGKVLLLLQRSSSLTQCKCRSINSSHGCRTRP